MLKVRTVASISQCDPNIVLSDSRCVFAPSREVFCILWDAVLLPLDYSLRFEEENGTKCGFEQVQTTHCTVDRFLVSTRRLDSVSQSVGDGGRPVFIVVGTEKEDESGGFGVEGGGRFAEDLGEDSLDLVGAEDGGGF